MPKKFESDQEAVFSMAFLTKVIANITIVEITAILTMAMTIITILWSSWL